MTSSERNLTLRRIVLYVILLAATLFLTIFPFIQQKGAWSLYMDGNTWTTYFKAFTFQPITVDQLWTVIPALGGAALFIASVVYSIVTHKVSRFLLSFVALASVVFATFTYHALPAPIQGPNGIMLYAAMILGGLNSGIGIGGIL